MTYLDNRRVLLATLDELFEGQLGIFIPIHVLEDLVDALIK